jgi:hypothetical protein
MFKLIALATLSLVFSHQALADYQCYGDKGATLSIAHTHNNLSADVNNTKARVVASLKLGESTEIFMGTYWPNLGYNLVDQSNQAVDLTVSQVLIYGGRYCRCGGETVSTYAKLAYSQGEIKFTCD